MSLFNFLKPNKQEFKVATGAWLRAVVAALARTFDIKIQRGNRWIVDVDNRVLEYDKRLEEADRDDALALILRAISGIDHATSYIIPSQFKDFVATTKAMVYYLEDMRYDKKMDGRYANSGPILEQYKRRVLSQTYGRLNNKRQMDEIEAETKKLSIFSKSPSKEQLLGSTYVFNAMGAYGKSELVRLFTNKKSSFFNPKGLDKDTANQLMQDVQKDRIIAVLNLFNYGLLFSEIHKRSAFYDLEEAIRDHIEPDKGGMFTQIIQQVNSNRASKQQVKDASEVIIQDMKVIFDCAHEAAQKMESEGHNQALHTQQVSDFYLKDIFPTMRRFFVQENTDGNGSGDGQDGSDADAGGQSTGSSQQDSKGNTKVSPTDKTLSSRANEDQKKQEKNSESMFGKKAGTNSSDGRMPETYSALQAETKHIVNHSVAKVNRILKDNRTDRYAGRYRSGKLNERRLYKQKTGDYKLFHRKQELQNKDYAFSLMIDESSSMTGPDFDQSYRGLVILNEVLGKIACESQIIGFSGDFVEAKGFDEKTVPQIIHSRLQSVFGGGTNIRNPFDLAKHSLLKNPIEQKVMIVLTDGEIHGADETHIKEQIHKNPNIKFFGIGVGVDLGHIFGEENTINVNDSSEIIGAFTGLIRKNIKQG